MLRLGSNHLRGPLVCHTTKSADKVSGAACVQEPKYRRHTAIPHGIFHVDWAIHCSNRLVNDIESGIADMCTHVGRRGNKEGKGVGGG